MHNRDVICVYLYVYVARARACMCVCETCIYADDVRRFDFRLCALPTLVARTADEKLPAERVTVSTLLEATPMRVLLAANALAKSTTIEVPPFRLCEGNTTGYFVRSGLLPLKLRSAATGGGTVIGDCFIGRSPSPSPRALHGNRRLDTIRK